MSETPQVTRALSTFVFLDTTGAVENLFFRYKRTHGNSLRVCGYESQKREARIGCNVLNRMAEPGSLNPKRSSGSQLGRQ